MDEVRDGWKMTAHNARGDMLFLNGADTDSRMDRRYAEPGDARKDRAALRSAFRWIDDEQRFVRNRIAYFEMRLIQGGRVHPQVFRHDR